MVPKTVLPINVFLRISRKGGCHNWRHSKTPVALKTKRDILKVFALGKKRNSTRHQNISYKIPHRELFTQNDAGPLYTFVKNPKGIIIIKKILI